MSQPRKSFGGYTLVEVTIFLAVSSALFVMAVALVSGQQAKTEFTQAVRNFESELNDIINDVATGYYVNPGDFSCSVTGGELDIAPGESEIGTNTGCVFLGKALQFAPDGHSGSYRVYTIAGKQSGVSGGSDLEDPLEALEAAGPKAIAPGSFATGLNQVPDATELVPIGGGVTIMWARSSDNPTSALVALSSVDVLSRSTFGMTQSGTLKFTSYTVGDGINKTTAETADQIVDTSNWGNPTQAVQVCLEGGDRQHAIVSIGGQNQQQYVNSVINSGDCPL